MQHMTRYGLDEMNRQIGDLDLWENCCRDFCDWFGERWFEWKIRVSQHRDQAELRLAIKIYREWMNLFHPGKM